MSSSAAQIYYSDKYEDEEYEYRHVMLPKDLARLVPKSHLMSENEWRAIGVQQSRGWVLNYKSFFPFWKFNIISCMFFYQGTLYDASS
ncbi:hypothetical protein ACKWTF_007822 [Chironomus riparius]